jgi:fructose-1,6-bisphosphatase I/sedoheptulose-1,7-bisphosphatase
MDTLIKSSIKKVITLDEYLTVASHNLSYGKALGSLILQIADSTKKIAALTAKGALVDAGQKLDITNVQGEVQTNIDVQSNDLFITALKNSGLVCGLVSEELETPLFFNEAEKSGRFLVAFDPLDGSSNVGVNVSTGSIFSILTAFKDTNKHYDFLQPGNKQLAAGYAIYGPSTMLVITIGSGTQGFTLCPESQHYVLTHPDMQMPKTASEYAINASNERYWEEPVQQYIYECIDGSDGKRERDFNMRWVASMVADIHRILMRGGLYLYPKDNKLPTKAGRLRLLYEANPMSYIVEQAGGKCTTGRQRILDIQPTDIHQRTPVILGSSIEVTLLELSHSEFDSKLADAQLLQHWNTDKRLLSHLQMNKG